MNKSELHLTGKAELDKGVSQLNNDVIARIHSKWRLRARVLAAAFQQRLHHDIACVGSLFHGCFHHSCLKPTRMEGLLEGCVRPVRI